MSTSQTPNFVEPQVVLGQPATGYSSDSLRTAFTKFNQHEHWPATPGNFLFHDVSINDSVSLLNQDLVDVLTSVGGSIQSKILTVTSNEIQVSNSASASVTNGILLLPNSRAIFGVNCTQGNNTLTHYQSGLQGVLGSNELKVLLTDTITGHFHISPSGGTYPVLLSLPYNVRVSSIILQIPSKTDNALPCSLSFSLQFQPQAQSVQAIYGNTLDSLSKISYSTVSKVIPANSSISLQLSAVINLSFVYYQLVYYKVV